MKEVHDHSFNINVAEYFRSVEKAILLKEFYGWIKINKDSKRNIHYGEAWTYNSAEALNDKFRYMHPKSIWRWINELSIDGLVCINRFNEKRYDKTNWYAINWAAYVAICEGKSELIDEYISHFKKFQKLVFDSQNEKSISQNKKRYSQNEESISQDKEPIPSLTNSSSSLTNSEAFVEKEFSTVTLIDEVDETSVEIHHVPDYFEIEGNDEFVPSKTTEKKEKKISGKRKETSAEDMDLVYQVVTYLNEKTEQAFQPGGEKTKSLILARHHADKWNLEDFKTVIDHKKSEWFVKDNLRQYLRPSTLFAAGHAEEYLQAAKLWKKKPVATSPGVVPLFRQENFVNTDRSKFKF